MPAQPCLSHTRTRCLSHARTRCLSHTLPRSYPFYNIKRYRGLFNVDTSDVLARLFHAVVLFFKADFLEFVDGNPDL